MKKLIGLMILIVVGLSTYMTRSTVRIVDNIDYQQAIIYSDKAIKGEDSVKNVTHYMTTTTKDDFASVYRKIKKPNAISLITRGSVSDVDKLLDSLGASKSGECTIDNVLVVYGYSPQIKGGVVREKSVVNVMIAVRGDRVTVGIPVILGSY